MKDKNLTNVYIEAITIARDNNQVVGEKRDYYITLEQLEEIIKKELDSNV